jgi:hypothetical protein
LFTSFGAYSGAVDMFGKYRWKEGNILEEGNEKYPNNDP